MIKLLITLTALAVAVPAAAQNENFYNAKFCQSIAGKLETRHRYRYPQGESFIKVDCETSTHVYEGGLDKRSSLDSVQQALFAATITGKIPAGLPNRLQAAFTGVVVLITG